MKKNPYRLGDDVQPVFYDLLLEPDLQKFTFEGSETLHFNLKRSTSRLTLHAAELKVHSAEIYNEASDVRHSAKKTTYDEKMETVTFHFTKEIKKGGNYLLHLRFSGTLNDQMHGFYRTSYTSQGQKRWGAATQFEATDARRCFPCVDEPAHKARFRATLRIAEHLTALSNMPVESETADRLTGKKTQVYQTTPVMSTYLLCFVVAELESIEGKDKNGVPIGIWTTPGKKEQGRFALEVAQHTLPYFSEWFGIPYALPKLDMVALPDFASGAMENWGLVTYRETALLVDAKNSSASAKQRVAEVIDHELAHQWFGNLVTMEWWTDLWLNEGFASYMGPKAVDHQFPAWRIWDQYVATEYLTALHDDSLKNSHAIEIEVQNPHEIREIFDHITYNKGSAVNRMLEHYLTEPVFRKGLRKYLKQFSYRNAKTVDLWKALEDVSGQPVRAIMAGYTKQEGFPMLDVQKKKNALEVSQSRFIFDGSPDKKKMSWKVPVTYLAEGQKKPGTFLLDSRRKPLRGVKGWIKFNPGQSGFYRTAYDKGLLGSLKEAIQKGGILSIDRMGILDDAFAQTRAGVLRTSETLDLVRVCKKDEDYNLWLTISGIVGSVESIVALASRPLYAVFVQGLFKSITDRSGWEAKNSDSHLDRMKRSLVLSRMGHFEHAPTLEEARRRFADFTGGKELDPNLRGAVYMIVAEHGGAGELKALQELYKKSELQEEKVRVLRSLTRLKGAEEVKEVLDFALSQEVRTQDTYVILGGFGSNEAARDANWLFVKQNWKELSKRYHGNLGLLGHILEGAVSGFKDKGRLEDVRQFFKANPVPGTERTCKQSLEVIQNNIAWSSRDARNVEDWLKTL